MASRGRRAVSRGAAPPPLTRLAEASRAAAQPPPPTLAESVVLPSSPSPRPSDDADGEFPHSSTRPRGSPLDASPRTPNSKRVRIESPSPLSSPSAPLGSLLDLGPAPASADPQLLGPGTPGPSTLVAGRLLPSPVLRPQLLPAADVRTAAGNTPRPRSALASPRGFNPPGPSPLGRPQVGVRGVRDPSAAQVFSLTQADICLLQQDYLDAYLRSHSAPPAVPSVPAAAPSFRPLPDTAGGFYPAPTSALPIPMSGASAVTSRPHHILSTAPEQLNPLESVYPIHEVHILMEGWRRHLPLGNLTNRKRSFAEKSGNTLTNTLVFGPGGLEIQPLSSHPSAEESLTMEEFIQASNCLVDMIPLYLKAGPQGEIGGPHAAVIGQAWRTHYDNLLRRPDFTEVFPVYRRYDIYLRLKWLTHSRNFLKLATLIYG
ncbi:hypothetical protein BD779DRAFT_1466530 [Infundibulicybe gibba]|nr:hypothetical protein BD779DRAFT_1466530 [Infundibulicybe gibba]